MVEEKIDKDGFIVTTQEESVPKEDREFAINVYSMRSTFIQTTVKKFVRYIRITQRLLVNMKNSSRAARLFVLKRFTQKTENSLVSKVFLI